MSSPLRQVNTWRPSISKYAACSCGISSSAAFTEDIGFRVRKVGGWKSTIFGGEGLVVDLTGPGTLTLQSRSEDAFLSWLIPQLPSQNASGGG